jgi:quinoprotein glucose dehydrogenase
MSTRGIRVWALGAVAAAAVVVHTQERTEWPVHGGNHAGTRFSPLARITRENVGRLGVVWRYHTGEPSLDIARQPSLQVTPLVVDNVMYISTPLGKVLALNPANGHELWRYDARVDPRGGYGDFASRGVATWLDTTAKPDAPCRRRIFLATVDARLVALDAANGSVCTTFGVEGTIGLRHGLRVLPFAPQAYQVTSPPTVVGDLVVVGSAIADNSRPAPASGEVRAFDTRTGELKWSWDPIPQDPSDPAASSWQDGSAKRTGAANVWSVMVADPERDLIFLPTSSAAPDYYGAQRPGDNRYANSIVALRASTGRVVWHFQTVHHDLWDYDNAAPPALVVLTRGGRTVPAVVQATKTGQLFVFHRETGAPVFPVEERPVPISTIPDEQASPTQPFSSLPPLSPHRLAAEQAFGATPEGRDVCRALIQSLRNEGIFTPPSIEGTLVIPSHIGGAHWGGVGVDERTGVAFVPVNRIAAMVQLIPAKGFDVTEARSRSSRLGEGFEYTVMEGTPYVMRRRILLGPGGVPCSPPPFGALVAVNLNSGARVWEAPLETPNLGGPLVTGGGLVFLAATLDRKFRAFDIATGQELWQADLPAGGRATPMTYESYGRQYVVIAAGGGNEFGAGDAIVAFAVQ